MRTTLAITWPPIVNQLNKDHSVAAQVHGIVRRQRTGVDGQGWRRELTCRRELARKLH